jgi:hypothetical protein
MGGRRIHPITDEHGNLIPIERRAPYQWTEAAEQLYLNLIIQGIRDGRRVGGHFKDQFWRDCLPPFAQQGLVMPTVDILNSKRTQWLKRWKTFTRLINLSGWGYNEATGLLQASEEAWEQQIAVDASARYFKSNPLKWRTELDEIFTEVTATGQYAERGIQKEAQPHEEPIESPSNESISSRPSLKRDISITSASSASPAWKRPRQDNQETEIVKALKAITNRLSNNQGSYRTRAVEILQAEFDDLSNVDFVVAMDVVKDYTEEFIALSSERRAIWLPMKIDERNNS